MTAPASPAAALVLAKEDLQGAVALVVADYRAFLNQGSPAGYDDAKAFANWHTACRTALTHLEQLFKLLKAAGGTDAAVPGEHLLAEADCDMGPPEDEE